jgi:hypothetical protein
MALKLETNIRNMSDFSERGWVAEMGDADDYNALVACEEYDLPVEVLCEATDGYYDVKTPSGRVINALSWWHLDGFTENGPSLFTNPE